MLSQTHLEPPRVDTILEAHHNCVVLIQSAYVTSHEMKFTKSSAKIRRSHFNLKVTSNFNIQHRYRRVSASCRLYPYEAVFFAGDVELAMFKTGPGLSYRMIKVGLEIGTGQLKKCEGLGAPCPLRFFFSLSFTPARWSLSVRSVSFLSSLPSTRRHIVLLIFLQMRPQPRRKVKPEPTSAEQLPTRHQTAKMSMVCSLTFVYLQI